MSKKVKADGFQDLLESDFSDLQKEKRRKENQERNSNFELFSYLEQESLRLTSQGKTYLDKFEILKRYPQGDTLIVQLNQALHENLVDLELNLLSEDSSFIKSIDSIFANYFNSEGSLK